MKRFVQLLLAASVGFVGTPLSAQQASPVTDAVFRIPPRGEWLTYGLNYAETRYSPLDRIDTETAEELELAWTYDIPDSQGQQVQIETAPIVSNGVMYAAGIWSVVFALDARTGELKWRWDPGLYGEESRRAGATR
jgi:glucose dehydrogenase